MFTTEGHLKFRKMLCCMADGSLCIKTESTDDKEILSQIFPVVLY